MRKVVVVGHADVVGDLAAMLRRETYHGLSVVAACVAGPARRDGRDEINAIPVIAGLGNVADVVERYDADTVAVLACPEMSGVRLRELAWELEKTGTDLCVAPALLDVAGPRTTIRPVAGLPLLHMDHPEFTGALRPALHRGGGVHPAGRPRSGAVPADPGRPGRACLHGVQVPHDGAGRRGPAGPADRPERDRRRHVQDAP
jgi:hypothetical protein